MDSGLIGWEGGEGLRASKLRVGKLRVGRLRTSKLRVGRLREGSLKEVFAHLETAPQTALVVYTKFDYSLCWGVKPDCVCAIFFL